MTLTKIFLTFCILSMSFSIKLEKSTLLGNPVDQSNIPSFEVNWFNTGFQGKDVGCGPEGDIYTVGLDGRLYLYNFLKNMYNVVEGDIEIPTISRVDVDQEGTPYVITTSGQVYYLNCNNHWVQLPGCGSDIGVGRAGEVWKIGCDERAGGFGIWKLFCKNKCKCNCERSCIRFRPMHYLANVYGDVRKCYWYRIEGGAKRIDVNPDGYPNVSTTDGVVYDYDGVNWIRVNNLLADDITVSNEGMTLVVGRDDNVYSLQNLARNQWVRIPGTASEICAGPFSQPWIVGKDNYIYTTSKFTYN